MGLSPVVGKTMLAKFKLLILIIIFIPIEGLSQTVSKSKSPLFWQLEYQGKTSYAFGSIHLGEKQSYPLPNVVMQGFAKSDALVVEVDLNAVAPGTMNALIGKYGVDPKRPLTSYLNDELSKQYQGHCQENQLPCAQFGAFKPWLVSVTLTAMQSAQAGFLPQYGIDKYFLQQAGKDKPIIQLEDAELQLKMFSGLSDKLQLELLSQSLQSGADDLSELIGHWYVGDEKALVKLFNKTSDSQLEQEFFEQLLYKRNVKMTEKMTSLLKTGQSLFLVVGTAHLIGKGNMLAMLEKQGVKVTRWQYKSAH